MELEEAKVLSKITKLEFREVYNHIPVTYSKCNCCENCNSHGVVIGNNKEFIALDFEELCDVVSFIFSLN